MEIMKKVQRKITNKDKTSIVKGYARVEVSQNRKLLTRDEMWSAITSRYPTLNIFTIRTIWGRWGSYKSREDLFKMIIEMKIHKSRHLTKKQKMKIEYELNSKIVEII